MNVLKKADLIARENKAAEKVAARREEKERIRLRKRKVQHTGIVYRVIFDALNGKRRFKVLRPESSIFGEAAVIQKRGKYLGTVCVQDERGEFRGCDECHLKEVTYEHIRLWQTINSGKPLCETYVEDNCLKDDTEIFSDALSEFMDELAEFLASNEALRL